MNRFTLDMEELHVESSLRIYQLRWLDIPEDMNFQQIYYTNRKFHTHNHVHKISLFCLIFGKIISTVTRIIVPQLNGSRNSALSSVPIDISKVLNYNKSSTAHIYMNMLQCGNNVLLSG
jgi:hypothetical protein